MSAGLTDVRVRLAVELEAAGLRVFDHIPEGRLVPPVVLMRTGDPYVTEGDTFDLAGMRVALELFVIAGTATNAAATRALDELIERVLLHLPNAWRIDSVSAPYMGSLVSSDSVFLTSRVQIARVFTLNEGA